MIRCSIIIPVFNGASLTRQCLAEVFHTTGGGCEVIVVDDASTDETRAVLKQYEGRIRVISHSDNLGFARSCNDGAANARGDFLVFLNNDTIPQKGWLGKLVEYADAHPRAAVVGAKLLFPNETIQHAGMVIGSDKIPVHIYAGFPHDHPPANQSRCFQMVTAACMLARRAPFGRAAGFDTAYLNGNEDVDLCLRLGEMGHEIHYCHDSVLYHLESSTRDTSMHAQAKNRQLYFSRWGNSVRQDDFLFHLVDSWQHGQPACQKLAGDARIQGAESNHAGVQKINGGSRPAPAGLICADDEWIQFLQQEKNHQLRSLLLHAWQQLEIANEKNNKLCVFLDQMQREVKRLYLSKRWRLANPIASLRRMLAGSSSPLPGYRYIDYILKGYKEWKNKHSLNGAANESLLNGKGALAGLSGRRGEGQ